MTTSNEITLDHIKSFFSLDDKLEELYVAPTATGGVGIDNIDKFPPPLPSSKCYRERGTDYVKKYLEKEENENRRQALEFPGSALSINTLDDVEESSTVVVDAPNVNDLNDATKELYSTYYQVPNRSYDPDLLITSYREQILRQLHINPVIIIQGPTGCGKTTQVPQYILDYHMSRGLYCNIIVTQPRKIAAISIARRVCKERNWQLKSIVGYQVAMDAQTSADTRLTYVTTGILLEKLVNARRMDMYTHVIIDEVHERDKDVDFAILLVKKFLKTNSQRVKVILMSATFDSSSFAKYFTLSSKGDPAPVIEVYGKSKEVTEHYLPELQTLIKKMPEFDICKPMLDPCLYEAVVKLMCVFDKIEKAEQNASHEQEYAPVRGAVLIFLPGYDEIAALSDTLKNPNFNKKYWIIPLHSSITVEEQSKVFKDPPSDHRKVIISTNIAESSITVPDVKYVIDFCLTKNLVTDQYTNYTCLQLEWASKSNCIQRKGRAGRVDIGRVYRMVPRSFYDEFPEYGTPEIKRVPLTSTILHVKKLNICEPLEMLAFALEPPNILDIENAVIQLKEALALLAKGSNPYDGELTFVGQVMANLPLDIKLSKLIIFGFVFHCLEECIIIAASLSLQSFFARPFQKALEAYRSRLAWANGTFSDCLAYLNAYKTWRKFMSQSRFQQPGGLSENKWCELDFIQMKRIREVDLLIKEIKSRLANHGIQEHHQHQNIAIQSEESQILMLKVVIAGAFFPHYFLQENLDEQEIEREINENDPHSTVVITGLPHDQGLLYAFALKDLMACCSDRMDIEFEGQKAYIKFHRNNDINASSILQSVYLAVKMRLLRIPLGLAIFSHAEAERKIQQIRQSKSSLSENKFPINRYAVKLNPFSKIKRIPLPPPINKTAQIFISHFINCGHFWAQSPTLENTNYLKFLDLTINKRQGQNLKPLIDKPVPEMLCLAPYSDAESGIMPKYYRAQVQKVMGSTVQVFFIDYGNVEKVQVEQLREIDENTPDVLTTPALAFECYLSEIRPVSIKGSFGNWSDKANRWFKSIVNGQVLTAVVYSVVQETVRLDLCRTYPDGTIESINEKLIENGFAERAEESYVSKQNHELRVQCCEYSVNSMLSESSSNILQLTLEDTKDFSSIKPTNRRILLRGPFNPLEVSYRGMTNLDRSRCVKVERDSVNSVSFNSEPEDPFNAMLVATGVTIGQNSDNITARNTTLMPKKRGLPALICLMFAPYVEIRTDKERKSYIGALCGLGFDPETGEALHPDHDIELSFDVEFTLDDWREINAIRMSINMLLNSQNGIISYSRSAINLSKERLQKTVESVLEKVRTPREPEFFKKSYKWNQIPSEFILESCEENYDCPQVLPLLRPPGLIDFVERKTELREHLKELYRLVEKNEQNITREYKEIECKLCSETVTSVRDLLVHLDSYRHQTKEKELDAHN